MNKISFIVHEYIYIYLCLISIFREMFCGISLLYTIFLCVYSTIYQVINIYLGNFHLGLLQMMPPLDFW